MNEPRGSGPNPERTVLVIGGGFAGLGAVWAARRAGSEVAWISGGIGASALYSGIVDGGAFDAETEELAGALGLVLSPTPRAVATREGVVRVAAGRDAAMLDLEALSGRCIAVADLGRDDWDAPLVAKSLQESAWARRTGTRFVVHRIGALVSGAERRIAGHDLARAFDAPERITALTRMLQDPAPADGWLLGPWLGIETPAARIASEVLGVIVGEVSSGLGGAAGARFSHKSSVLLGGLDVVTLETRALRVSRSDGRASGVPLIQVDLQSGALVHARAVVLAIGGMIGGGIALAEVGAERFAPWELSLEAPVIFELDGEIADGASSLAGLSFERLGLGALQRIGVRARRDLRLHPGVSLYGAGEILAGRPRTVLSALSTGILAGKNAAREALA